MFKISKLRYLPSDVIYFDAVMDITQDLIKIAKSPRGCRNPLGQDEGFKADLTKTFVRITQILSHTTVYLNGAS